MSVYASSERDLPDPKRSDLDNNPCEVKGIERNFCRSSGFADSVSDIWEMFYHFYGAILANIKKLFMANNGKSLELKFALYTLAATILVAAWAFICNFINTSFAITNPAGQIIIALVIGFLVFKLFMLIREKAKQKSDHSS